METHAGERRCDRGDEAKVMSLQPHTAEGSGNHQQLGSGGKVCLQDLRGSTGPSCHPPADTAPLCKGPDCPPAPSTTGPTMSPVLMEEQGRSVK